jgi:hypothetical protein
VAHENVVRSGYLRKVTKNGDWRCARCVAAALAR